ncbi:uncharacterized protein LOC109862447 [Pseudomyrmex gracilis]|uniref:uncharacterized protein LOC109862447 n=1 Tax=Pseudomyrmex gracilis TaxID=219809 RepID=UPI0009953343|nr:uncharacterized protein LOC109862447 [Pseudomyrmex gracilis]
MVFIDSLIVATRKDISVATGCSEESKCANGWSPIGGLRTAILALDRGRTSEEPCLALAARSTFQMRHQRVNYFNWIVAHLKTVFLCLVLQLVQGHFVQNSKEKFNEHKAESETVKQQRKGATWKPEQRRQKRKMRSEPGIRHIKLEHTAQFLAAKENGSEGGKAEQESHF